MKVTTRRTKLKKNIWKLYLLKLFGAFVLFTPVIVLFFKENGLSMTEIMILQSAYSIAVIGLEVPSGYAADVLGRRKTLFFGSLCMTIGIAIYSVGQGFWGFLLGELTFAVGGAFYSGADSAMMYDTLKELGRESEYKKLWGKTGSYALVATAAASIVGGIIGGYNLRLTLVGMVPIFLTTLPICYSMREPEREKKVAEEGHFKEIIETGKNTFIHSKKLRWLIVYSAIITLVIKGGYFLYQPYFKEVAIPVAWFGAIFAGMNLFSALIARYAEEIEEALGMKTSLISLVVLTGTGFLLLGQIAAVYSFIFATLHQFVRGFEGPVMSDYINKLVESRDRSTVLSLQNLSGRMLYASSIPLIGLITDSYGLQVAMNSLALTSFILGGLILGVMAYDSVI
ncbi:MAG: MFS transporter [Candidatus Nanohalobium sp.]